MVHLIINTTGNVGIMTMEPALKTNLEKLRHLTSRLTHRHKLLMVEDDVIVVNFLCQYISNTFPIDIVSCFTGIEAINTINDNDEIDLFWIDLKLPDINGSVIAKIIRLKWPDSFVIICTGLSPEEAYLVDFKSALYIYKPAEIKTIEKAILAGIAYLSHIGK
jgi:DNA-binding response OmpR family regulator